MAKTPAKARKARKRLLEEEAKIIRRLLDCMDARDDILAYAQLTMPHPKFPLDRSQSKYRVARHHEVMAAAVHAMERGEFKNLIINMPPRHGKTELATKRHIAWYVGRHPDKSVIVGTYSETSATDYGRAIRTILQHPAHAQAFPESQIKARNEASDRLEMTAGGVLAFVGRGGAATGRGGDLIVVDDPIKDNKEAQSQAIRDQLWTWFTRVILSRRMDANARVLVIQTRWHEDDLVGRLTDPSNPHFDEEEARDWKIIDLPALAVDDQDPMGRKKGEALWPERFPAPWLQKFQRRDPVGFGALYQCRPAPEDGAFFMADHLMTYKRNELPDQLRKYCASDHAVGVNQKNDSTCVMPAGVDPNNDIYILPDLVWGRYPTDRAVEAMLRVIRDHRPLFWWAEKGQITKSIGPFFRKRMLEEQLFASIIEVHPAADKQTRAQSIQARMAYGRVRFPEFAPWWPQAREQLLKFPYGAHDDFVDALALLGLGLVSQVGAYAGKGQHDYLKDRSRTFGEMFKRSNQARREERLAKSVAGW